MKFQFIAIKGFIILFLVVANDCNAQQSESNPYLNSWFSFLNQVKWDSSWSTSVEIHERTGKILADQGQFLLRPSIDYYVHPNVSFSLGYTFINVKPFQPLSQPISYNENNVWEQVLLKYNVGNIQFQNRLRFEQRWIQHINQENTKPIIAGTDYRNRFRYRFNVQFNFGKLKKHDLFFHGFDEVWINLNNQLSPISLNRNWLYLGVGIKLNTSSNAQIGYLNQIDKMVLNNLKTDVLQLTLVKKLLIW